MQYYINKKGAFSSTSLKSKHLESERVSIKEHEEKVADIQGKREKEFSKNMELSSLRSGKNKKERIKKLIDQGFSESQAEML